MVAKINKVDLDEKKILDILRTPGEEKERNENVMKPGLLDLFKYKRLCLRTLILCFNWMVNIGTYYGLALSASNLGGNPYYNYLISAAVEIPAYAFNLAVLNNPRYVIYIYLLII